MKLIRDLENKRIIINDNDLKILELYFIPSYFLFKIYTNNPIIITEELDTTFYNNLVWFMNNSYEFPKNLNNYNKKTKNELIWLSEGTYNLEDKEECNMISRLIIKKINKEFYISYNNPFYKKYNIDREGIISFSPAGNGFICKNSKTGIYLQDEVIQIFYNTLYNKNITINKSLTKKKK